MVVQTHAPALVATETEPPAEMPLAIIEQALDSGSMELD